MQVIVNEGDIWTRNYRLGGCKQGGTTTYVTENGDFIASVSAPTRKSKGLPVTEEAAKFSPRRYKDGRLPLPRTLEEMDAILAWDSWQSVHNAKEHFSRRTVTDISVINKWRDDNERV